MTDDARPADDVYWIQCLEDSAHAWCKHHGSPVLLRVRFAEALDRPTRLRLCMASAFRPVAARLEVSPAWDAADNSFGATVVHILMPSMTASPTPTRSATQRQSFGAPMR